MAKTDFKSVAEYLATLPEASRTTLERVRRAVRKAVPDGEEVISYQIPALKLQGTAVIYFAAWKEHYALYPATKQVVSTFEQELAPYELRKGTIRFPLAKPVPTKLIAAITKVRVQETIALLVERQAKRDRAKKKPHASRNPAKPRPRPKTRKAR